MTRHALAFLANDRYLDWTKAFLESIRSQDVSLPLYCIPHGGPTDGVAALRQAFNFAMLEEGIDVLDDFARELFPSPDSAPYRGNLRKYAALTLSVDEVAYFDVDTVMLIPPRRLFGHIRPGKIDLVYLDTSPEWVYAPERLTQAQSLFPAMPLMSAGTFVTSPRALSIEELIGSIERNRKLYLSLRHPKVHDQPVLNFALHQMRKQCRHIAELDSGIAGVVWARDRGLRLSGGRAAHPVRPGEVVAIHWAGRKRASRWEVLSPRKHALRRLRRSLQWRAERRIRAAHPTG
jgi:hypothetical protein